MDKNWFEFRMTINTKIRMTIKKKLQITLSNLIENWKLIYKLRFYVKLIDFYPGLQLFATWSV